MNESSKLDMNPPPFVWTDLAYTFLDLSLGAFARHAENSEHSLRTALAQIADEAVRKQLPQLAETAAVASIADASSLRKLSEEVMTLLDSRAQKPEADAMPATSAPVLLN